MAPEVYLDEPWLTIRWDGAHKCVYAAWSGSPDSADFRAGTLKILSAIRDRKATALISDNRNLGAIANEDQVWIDSWWVPIAVKSGLARIAVILAPQGLAKTASEGIISRFEDKLFTTRTFESLDEALSWIAES